jgi:hypothetical protein
MGFDPCNHALKIRESICVATLALGSRPRQRGCKGAGQREARESHQGLPGETDLRGQISMACGALYINGNLLKRRCLKWARIAHLDI